MARPSKLSNNQIKAENVENLFESFPHGTLALMGAGCGFIATTTLFMELFTSQIHATALEMQIPFISLPMGVATMVLAGLTARANKKYALPALVFGIVYWMTYLGWMIA